MPRDTAASEKGNYVISSLRDLRCHCNPDNSKFSLSNIVVVFFQNLFYYNGDVVYAQTWEVLTLKNPTEPPLINVVILNLKFRYQNPYFELNSIA